MEELLRAIEEVQERIARHRAELQKSEALTRYALIDPILRALGWDTEDPEQVRPEFPTETGKPDYALIWEGKPRIMVEAKPLGVSLEEARRKGFQYCFENKVRFYVITDGAIWKVWDLGEIGGKELVELDILKDPPGEAARKLLALWRPAAAEIKPAPATIIQVETTRRVEERAMTKGVTLRELEAAVKPFAKPPCLISFPDGRQEAFKRWKGLLVAVASWVEPKLRGDQVPIKLGERFLLNPQPVHSDGQPFRAPVQVGKLWLETNFSAKDCVRHACRLLEAVGVSPDQVRVEF
jgi:predicted type IV restriction endonuclease